MIQDEKTTERIECPICRGRGQVYDAALTVAFRVTRFNQCRNCEGTGKMQVCAR